jgi:DMSO/TMAO reductase YedYZ molybdopterin-dependent catalytic subunit
MVLPQNQVISAPKFRNALAGTQVVDRGTYVLTVDGLVDHPLSLRYADLQVYPQVSKLVDLDFVEGWSYTGKWTGPPLNYIFNDAGVKPRVTHPLTSVTSVTTISYLALS